MKKFKKLVPAFCMLLLSAVMLASGTFAWFSVNDRVSATGMQVEAKANTQFLVIGNELTTANKYFTVTADTTVGFKKAAGGIAEEGDRRNKVYPVAKKSADWDAKVAKTTTGLDTINDNEWFTANSTVFSEVTGGSGDALAVKNATKVDLGDENYFLTYVGYVGLAINSETYEGDLEISFAGAENLNESIKYVIEVTKYAVTAKGDKIGEYIGNRTTASEVPVKLVAPTDENGTGAEVVEIKVYVCVNGYGDDIKDGAATVSGELQLGIALAPATV